MIVVAGPPGSGKTSSFPVTDFGLDGFNIDDRCAQLLGRYRAIPCEVRRSVAADCERFVIEHIHAGRAFAVETTPRTTATINQARQTRTRGFATELIFVATASVEENVARVLQHHPGVVPAARRSRAHALADPHAGHWAERAHNNAYVN
jgi:predicted ABC-type ATPase